MTYRIYRAAALPDLAVGARIPDTVPFLASNPSTRAGLPGGRLLLLVRCVGHRRARQMAWLCLVLETGVCSHPSVLIDHRCKEPVGLWLRGRPVVTISKLPNSLITRTCPLVAVLPPTKRAAVRLSAIVASIDCTFAGQPSTLPDEPAEILLFASRCAMRSANARWLAVRVPPPAAAATSDPLDPRQMAKPIATAATSNALAIAHSARWRPTRIPGIRLTDNPPRPSVLSHC